jgi:hypothetical protein
MLVPELEGGVAASLSTVRGCAAESETSKAVVKASLPSLAMEYPRARGMLMKKREEEEKDGS